MAATTTVEDTASADEPSADVAFSVGEELDALEQKAFALDAAFRVPYTQTRVGIDPLLGLLPGVGDGAMMLVSVYIVYKGARLGASSATLARMTGNLVVEVLLGVIPVVGDVIDFVWSMNLQNVGYLRAEADDLDGNTNVLFLGVTLLTPVVMLLVMFQLLLSLLP